MSTDDGSKPAAEPIPAIERRLVDKVLGRYEEMLGKCGSTGFHGSLLDKLRDAMLVELDDLIIQLKVAEGKWHEIITPDQVKHFLAKKGYNFRDLEIKYPASPARFWIDVYDILPDDPDAHFRILKNMDATDATWGFDENIAFSVLPNVAIVENKTEKQVAEEMLGISLDLVDLKSHAYRQVEE